MYVCIPDCVTPPMGVFYEIVYLVIDWGAIFISNVAIESFYRVGSDSAPFTFFCFLYGFTFPSKRSLIFVVKINFEKKLNEGLPVSLIDVSLRFGYLLFIFPLKDSAFCISEYYLEYLHFCSYLISIRSTYVSSVFNSLFTYPLPFRYEIEWASRIL